jgi:hypothetical protein
LTSHGDRRMYRKLFAFAILGVIAVASHLARADDPPAEKEKGPTLMGMLSEWQYPDSKFHGAQMSDAGVADIGSIKNKAFLTTSDSAEKVLKYYCDKLKVDANGKNLGEKPGERIKTKRSVLVQDDSTGRPLKLYVIAVNETGFSTTLMISRADGEDETHIAWSNFRQVWPEVK